MLPVGFIAGLGDWYYLQGIKYNSLDYFNKAKEWFPLDRNLAVVEAEFYLQNRLVSREGLIAINNALKIDIYSSRLWDMQMQYASVLGDRELAAYSFRKLYNITPNAPIVKELIKRGAKIKD